MTPPRAPGRRRLGLALLAAASAVGCIRAEDLPTAPPDVQPEPVPVYTTVVTGNRHSCALDEAGRPYCWGSNASLQLGIGNASLVASSQPTRLPGDHRFVDLAAGGEFTCGLQEDGTVSCWEVGPGGAQVRPTRVAEVEGARLLAAGFTHVCAVTTAADAVCWGRGSAGELGDGRHGTDVSAVAPAQVEGPVDVTDVAVGIGFSCTLAGGGGVWCWGSHEAGQLGRGTLADGPCLADGVPFPCAPLAAQVPGLPIVLDVAAGFFHVCALAGGDVLCWGDAEAGQLGSEAEEESCRWAQPPGLERLCARVPGPLVTSVEQPFASIEAGGFHTCGLTAGGSAHCWGANTFGQLGGAGLPAEGPHAVSGGHVWEVLAAGQVHTCGVADQGKVFCWGNNDFGQLGVLSASETAPREIGRPLTP